MAEKWMEQRGEWLAAAIRREETAKVPYIQTADQYMPYYLGIDKGDVKTYEQAADITSRFTLDTKTDGILVSFEPVNLTVPPKRRLLGGGSMIVKKNTKMQDSSTVEIMSRDEYPEFIKDPVRFLINTVMPRRYEVMNKDPETQLEAYRGLMGLVGELPAYDAMCVEKGTNFITGGIAIMPVDYIFDFLREFKGISGDIKRKPEWLRDAGLALAEQMKPMLATIKPAEDKAVFVPMHLPPFMRPKEFEMCYWPSYKMLADYMVEELGLNVLYYFEKSYAHILDYLQELPKKGIIGLFQEDDRFEIKKKLGDKMAISGWLSTSLMGMGTKEQCLDHVKELIDTMAPGGGFIIAPDTPMLFPADAKPENLKAVSDYIFEHRF